MSDGPQTMTPFWLDDVLSSLALPSRSNEYTTYLLESPLPGVHSNFGDDESLRAPQTATQIHTRARPVIAARDDRLLPGYQRNIEDGGSSNAATNIFARELGDWHIRLLDGLYLFLRGSDFDPPMHEGGQVAELHSECLKYLCEKGPTFMTGSAQSKETSCAALLNMAEHVKVLSPADDPIPRDILLNMCRWRDSLCALINEMRTVDERFPSLGCSSGVYVLTSSSYAAFLRALAAEIADRLSTHRFPPAA